MFNSVQELISHIQTCTYCQKDLPKGANPIFRIHPKVHILIISQAPGSIAHESGIPWDDPGGERLRSWLGLSYQAFYNTYYAQIGILPIGLCYPGKGKSGDLPPMPACAPKWHGPARRFMPNVQLTLLVGRFAQRYYLGNLQEKSLTETVKNWQTYLQKGYFPLPHPSPRNRIWMRQNPWFEQEVVGQLQLKCHEILQNG